MQKFAGYRTLIFIAVSTMLKILVARNLISSTEIDASTTNQITDAVLLVMSGVSDLMAMYFRVKAEKPGQLSEAAKAQKAWEATGIERRQPDSTSTPEIKKDLTDEK